MVDRRSVGASGEDAVAAWYEQSGYSIAARNWRCTHGELDIVAVGGSGRTVVFCEVKTRASTIFGSPFEAVTPAKQRRLRRLAASWLTGARHCGFSGFDTVRFDVAAVYLDGAGDPIIEVLEQAF
jgi:putative endonuclease